MRTGAGERYLSELASHPKPGFPFRPRLIHPRPLRVNQILLRRIIFQPRKLRETCPAIVQRLSFLGKPTGMKLSIPFERH